MRPIRQPVTSGDLDQKIVPFPIFDQPLPTKWAILPTHDFALHIPVSLSSTADKLQAVYTG